MDRESELTVVRRAYAKQILAAAGVANASLEHAYATVRRERFLGAGPWQMYRHTGAYAATPEADPVYLYVDQVVGLVTQRNVNNGQPSLHAMLIGAANLGPGEHVVHVGAGSGYYSAIMAQIVGSTGKVTAIECDPALAERARDCLSGLSNVRVLEGDGASVPFDVADVIYVNAGVTHPADAWLDGLSAGGRLIIPLTTDENFPIPDSPFDPLKAMRSGAYFLVQRCGQSYEARVLLPTAIIPALGAGRDRAAEAALSQAFAKGGLNRVAHLVRNAQVPDDRCWLKGPGWGLTCE